MLLYHPAVQPFPKAKFSTKTYPQAQTGVMTRHVSSNLEIFFLNNIQNKVVQGRMAQLVELYTLCFGSSHDLMGWEMELHQGSTLRGIR